PTPAGSASIPAAADTYLSTFHKSSAFGSRADMIHRLAGMGGEYTPMLRFAIFRSQGGPVPDGAEIVSARVRVYKSSAYNYTYALHPILGAWDGRVTYNAAPAIGEAVAQASVAWEPGWLEWDVTATLRDAPHGWAMIGVSGNTNIKKFVSREGDPAFAPRLEVEWR
ncbi:MAG TPA: DNRLRE domain-containing protein, partial [Burkholderiaceae bacterium]|nr:DNRLRE domain-containing protein [Burkholderiaceae bacterium]